MTRTARVLRAAGIVLLLARPAGGKVTYRA